MTALLLLAVAAAITCVAALIALKRWTRALDKHTGRHTSAWLDAHPEQDDLMTYSREIRCRVVAAQQAVEQLTGKAVA